MQKNALTTPSLTYKTHKIEISKNTQKEDWVLPLLKLCRFISS